MNKEEAKILKYEKKLALSPLKHFMQEVLREKEEREAKFKEDFDKLVSDELEILKGA